MKKTMPYKINWKTNTIYVSKRLQDAANQMGTNEFDTMRRLQELNMPIEYQEIHRKPKYPKWKYEKMEMYLDKVENAEVWKKKYYALKDTSSHGEVWSWFRKTFFRFDKKGRRITPTFTNDHKFVVPQPKPTDSKITHIGAKAAANGAKTEPNADTPAAKGAKTELKADTPATIGA